MFLRLYRYDLDNIINAVSLLKEKIVFILGLIENFPNDHKEVL